MGFTMKFKHPVYCSKVGGGWGSLGSSNTLSTAVRWVVGLTKKFTLSTTARWVGGWGSPRSSNTLSTAARWVVGITKKFKHPIYCSKVGGGDHQEVQRPCLLQQGGWRVGGGDHQEVQTPYLLQQDGWVVGITKKFKHPIYCSKVGGGWGSPRSSNTLSTAARWVGGGDHQEVQALCLLQEGGWVVGLTKKFKHPFYCRKVGGAHEKVETSCKMVGWMELTKKSNHQSPLVLQQDGL